MSEYQRKFDGDLFQEMGDIVKIDVKSRYGIELVAEPGKLFEEKEEAKRELISKLTKAEIAIESALGYIEEYEADELPSRFKETLIDILKK